MTAFGPFVGFGAIPVRPRLGRASGSLERCGTDASGCGLFQVTARNAAHCHSHRQDDDGTRR
jgi:hypothetical protein